MSFKIHKKHFVITSLVALPLCTQATDLRLAADLMYFDYEETDVFGSTLNQETGFMPGFTVAASEPYRSLHNTVEFSLYGGDVDYDGQTQAGQPHQTTTEETIYRLLYKLSWSPEDTEGAFYGKAYWQQWDRNILPNDGVSGLFERYQWWTVEAGVQVPFIKDEKRRLLLELGMLTTFNGTIMVDLSSSGYGSPELGLGNGIGFSGELKYDFRQTKNSSFQFGVQLKGWEFGRSNSKTIFNGTRTLTITEPDSTTLQTTLSASYIHYF
jgi:hypothetical protein